MGAPRRPLALLVALLALALDRRGRRRRRRQRPSSRARISSCCSALTSPASLLPARRPRSSSSRRRPRSPSSDGPAGPRSCADRGCRCRLPGRPNGHTGWIRRRETVRAETAWHLVVDPAQRVVIVYHAGHPLRSISAVVGSSSTPTPPGEFFVEESIALRATDVGAPFALALSGRSAVLQEFAGGPGRSPFTDGRTSAAFSALPSRTAAFASAPGRFGGLPRTSAAGCR